MKNWRDQSILILGAARQGLALARYLCMQGARVTLNDQSTPEKLETARQSLADYPIRWVLGEHPLSLLDQCDLVCLSGGIPLSLPIVQEAISRGIAVSNDSQIFMEAVPSRVIGITGSAGKTTTTTLTGRIAQAAIQAPRHVWVGGNIGNPLINHLDQIHPDDLVILELSSFQLEQMTRSPQISALLNITPNHLDRHGTMEAYTTAKAHILDYQKPGDVTVLNREDPGSWGLAPCVRGELVSFGIRRPEDKLATATFFEDNWLYWQSAGNICPILAKEEILLPGKHNLLNVLAAAAITLASGMPVATISAGVCGFKGVTHRLELVREWGGARWYNDSIATAPERTSAAINAFEEPLVLMLGGRDKKLPWDSLAELIHKRVDHVVVFGEAAGLIEKAIGDLNAGQRPYTLARCANLEEAVQSAAEVVEPGDVVLFSPGGTSFDEFKDFEERGERFKLWINQLP